MIKMKGLGRGLDALLSGNDKAQGDEQRNLPVDRLKPGKYQPRTHMDDAALAELAASIKAQGVMQPILVRAVDPTPGAERYEIGALTHVDCSLASSIGLEMLLVQTTLSQMTWSPCRRDILWVMPVWMRRQPIGVKSKVSV